MCKKIYDIKNVMYENTKLNNYFDVLQMLSPSVEPQDVATNVRHYFTMETQLSHSNKFPFVFSRGKPQVMECFEMLRDFRGVSDSEFESNPYCFACSRDLIFERVLGRLLGLKKNALWRPRVAKTSPKWRPTWASKINFWEPKLEAILAP